jgi:hypothetical protein
MLSKMEMEIYVSTLEMEIYELWNTIPFDLSDEPDKTGL